MFYQNYANLSDIPEPFRSKQPESPPPPEAKEPDCPQPDHKAQGLEAENLGANKRNNSQDMLFLLLILMLLD